MSQKLVRTYPHMYSRKPGNYNGTIIFEIDIMKKSSPISSGFTCLPLLFWCSQLMLSDMLQCRQKQTRQQKLSEKVKFDKDFN